MRCLHSFAPFLFAAAALAQGPALAPLSAAMDRLSHNLRLQGTALTVMRDSGDIHRSEYRKLSHASVIPIGAASRWLAVATVLTLVDDGTLDLDLPVARYLEEFDRPDKEAITLRQCMSCTAGFHDRAFRVRGWDSDRFVEAVAKSALRNGPGECFLYTDTGYQIAVIAAERASGKTLHKLFAERIARPLGLLETRFGSLKPLGGEPGTTPLPWAAGGAIASLDDYGKFVRMLLAEGRVGDRQVLSQASVKAMLQDQVLGQAQVNGEDFDGETRYGLGAWIVTLADGGRRATIPGAFGFSPWIEVDLGIGGIFAVRDVKGRVKKHVEGLQDEVRDVARSPLVAGADATIELGHGGLKRRYHLHVPAVVTPDHDAPLLLVLHDAGSDGEQLAVATRFRELADRAGFLVAFPDGTGSRRQHHLTWNADNESIRAAANGVDDTAFLRAVVADVAAQHPLDSGRIYAVGHGAGGAMCHRLAREAADLFAGVAVVGGTMRFTTADSRQPVGVLIMQGTVDQQIGADGVAAQQAAIDYYLARNGLQATADAVTAADQQQVRIETYGKDVDGEATWSPLRVITLTGAGHAWPGATEQARRLEERPFDYDATHAVWQFFEIVRRNMPAGQPPAMPR